MIIHWLYYCTVNVYVIHFCDGGLFFLSGNKSVYRSFFSLFINICIAVRLSREGMGFVKRFSPTTLLCLSQTRTWISIDVCCGFFFSSDSVVVHFVDIDGIADAYCLIFFSKTKIAIEIQMAEFYHLSSSKCFMI